MYDDNGKPHTTEYIDGKPVHSIFERLFEFIQEVELSHRFIKNEVDLNLEQAEDYRSGFQSFEKDLKALIDEDALKAFIKKHRTFFIGEGESA